MKTGKNILIINSSGENSQPLISLFAELKQKNYNFYLLSSAVSLRNQFKQKGWPAKKIYLGPNLNNKFNSLFFIALLPAISLVYLILLIYLTHKQKITTVICLNWNEKIIMTPITKILKIKTFWLEYPNINYQSLSSPLLWLYKFSSKWATQIVFTNLTKTQLKKLNINENHVKLIPLGIKINQFKHQDTIFNKLARDNQNNFRRKYFTVGTIVDLNHKQKIEALFQAIKICLAVINDLQLIIVGNGKERKNLAWLAKKMNIDNLVWFIGEQSYLRKWLDGFDIFMVTSETPNLEDLNICLRAMAAGLPVVGPNNLGLEDIVCEEKTGLLVDIDNSETLAQQIIKLHQNKRLRLELGKNAKEQVDKYFSIDKMVKQLEEIINT